MAKVTLAPQFLAISGTICKNMNGNKIIAKTYKRNGKAETRMYTMKRPVRKRKPSKLELSARTLFVQRQAYVQQLRRSGDKRLLKDLWAEAKERFK